MDGVQTKIIKTLFQERDVLTENCLYKTDSTLCQLISLNQKPVLIHDSLEETEYGILTLKSLMNLKQTLDRVQECPFILKMVPFSVQFVH